MWQALVSLASRSGWPNASDRLLSARILQHLEIHNEAKHTECRDHEDVLNVAAERHAADRIPVLAILGWFASGKTMEVVVSFIVVLPAKERFLL